MLLLIMVFVYWVIQELFIVLLKVAKSLKCENYEIVWFFVIIL